MVSDLPLVDQVWMFSLVIALIVMGLAILALLGPEFVRELHDVFSAPATQSIDFNARMKAEFQRRHELCGEAIKRDADIQELQ